MKKLNKVLLLILLMSVLLSASHAQNKAAFNKGKFRVGATAGINLTQLENYGGGIYALFDYLPGWHAGVAMQYKWGGFLNYALQVEPKYSISKTDVEPVVGPIYDRTSIGTIEVPLQFQFGTQLSPIFRPFITASIIPAYIVNTEGELFDYDQMSANRFNVAAGAGIGFDLWKFQFQCRYRFGLSNFNKGKDIFERLKLGGFEFSMAVLF